MSAEVPGHQTHSADKSKSMRPAVYILASKPNGTLYTGVTSDLVRRVWEHKSDAIEGFSRRYGVHDLVYYELHESMEAAIGREKQIKAGSRKRKLQLIEGMNPGWKDLYEDIL
ncbi:MAG: GIY-YIG nuclease family protein [Burkholderiaceae bacterium]